MEMFDSLFNKIFVDSSKTGKWKYQPQNINKDHVSLLLAWPGMFLFNLVERLGNDDFSTKINELKELCDSAKEDLAIATKFSWIRTPVAGHLTSALPCPEGLAVG